MDVYISGQKINSWAECYGGSDSDIANCIIQTTDGGYVVAGYSMSNNSGDVSSTHGHSDFWIIKLSSSGLLEWQKCYGGSNWDKANSVVQTRDEGYVLAGETYSNDGDVSGSQGNSDCWVIKLSSDGSLEWQKCYGGSNWDKANSIIQTRDGGYALAGGTGSYSGGNSWVVKLSSDGSLEWQKVYGGVDLTEANRIIQTEDGGYAVAGYTMSNINGNHGGCDYFVVKFRSDGFMEWQRCYGGSAHDIAHSIIQTTDGGYAVAGYVNSNNSGNVSDNHGGSDYWIIKLSTQGILEWQKCFGGVDYDEAHSIIQTIDGGYVVAGFTYSNDEDVSGNHGDSDYWVIKLSSSGSLEWQKCYGGSATDIAYSLIQNTEGGYVVAGYSLSNSGDVSGNYGDEDYWVIKLDNNGNLNIP
jgi:hypothetical protein